MRRLPSRGLTLIEAMVCIAIAAILAAAAAPAFIETIGRVRLDGAVNNLSVDLQYTRSEAIRRRTSATLTVVPGGAAYSVTYLDGNTTPEIKQVTMPTGVTLASSGAVQFESLRGTAVGRTFTVTSSQTGAQLQAQTNAIGRVQICSPSGSYKGYPTC